MFGEKFARDRSENSVNRYGRIFKRYDIEAMGRDYDVIHGHVHVRKYAALNRPYITWVRDPVSRMESHYSVIKSRALPIKAPAATKKLKRWDLCFVDYCKVRGNVLHFYFGHMKVEDFAFVGVVERYRESLRLFSKLTGKKVPRYSVKNRRLGESRFYEKIQITEEMRKGCRSFVEKDLLFYEQANLRLDEELRRYEIA
jgi:hypothetical protein